MSVWAIGDIQGCCTEFEQLLNAIGFEPHHDTLWLTGDLVNRGPRSLDTLRKVKALGERAIAVLGNHDLHLLAISTGAQPLREHDTLDAILAAPDRDDLLNWLRCRPLLHHDAALGYTLIHAGLPPQWDLAQAQDCVREVQAVLQGDNPAAFLAAMYGNEPARWDPALTGTARLRFTVNCLTRLRYCRPTGEVDFHHKGPPGSQPADLLPWFAVPGRRSADERIIFGHWSTLGATDAAHGIFPLDTGCVWGGQLTALRLDGPPESVNIACPGAQPPG